MFFAHSFLSLWLIRCRSGVTQIWIQKRQVPNPVNQMQNDVDMDCVIYSPLISFAGLRAYFFITRVQIRNKYNKPRKSVNQQKNDIVSIRAVSSLLVYYATCPAWHTGHYAGRQPDQRVNHQGYQS